MPRLVISNPLQGASPQLQPTARPQAIQPGATPEPRRSPLGELAEAFRDFSPSLHASLRAVAARDEHDALAAGELAAMKANAAARMGEIDGLIKKEVDAGKFPAVRAPAFERGFRSRVGQDLAQSLFQEKLLSTVPSATQVANRLDPEKAIADTYAEVGKQIHPDDFYARQAFDATAQGVIAGYRQRVAEGYTAAYRAAGEQTMADQGSELVLHLGSAAAEDAPLIRTAVKAHLDEIRRELPSAEVNPFFVKNVVGPAIDKLVSEQKYTDARHLLDEMDQLDVTGKGGLLGQTAVGKAAFSDMRAKVERETRASQYESYTRMRQDREVKQSVGDADAGDTLQQLRLANDGRLPQDQRFKLIDAYRKANASDPQRVEGFAAAVHNEFDNEDKHRADPKALSDLEGSIDTLHKDDLDRASDTLTALYNLGSIAPSDRTRVAERIKKLNALYGAIDEQDIRQFKRSVYSRTITTKAQEGLDMTMPVVDFGETGKAEEFTNKLWDNLSPELKEKHEIEVTARFNTELQDEMRRIGDPLKIPAGKALAVDRATATARTYARTLLREMTVVKAKAAVKTEIAKQQAQIRTATLLYNITRVDTRTIPGDVPGDAPETVTTKTAVPVEYHLTGYNPAYASADFGKPRAEHDQVPIRFPGIFTLAQWASLPELAKDAAENPQPEAKAKAKELYGIAKGLLGYTPEEVVTGKTKHGVAFDAAQIDPKVSTVFRNVAELNKHWNNGKPDEVFHQLGDLLDPKDTMTARQFYLAQRALLTPHK